MHLILTHEQADFDAIASLLAANLLEPEAQAVLPRRVNRNVRAFLSLYSDELPFLEIADLPKAKVERVTLVDTQSIPSIKGVDKKTDVHVIDHHPQSDALQPEWETHIEVLGATTTILVEWIQAQSIDPSGIEATLMLLGIYEDTGSLSYIGTSPRDMRACTWLLEAGANLDVAVDYLNHPLSHEQRELYDRLLTDSQTLDVNGYSIVLAPGAAMGMQDEISSIAHKLRDLFDPDGIFVLVELNDHVQLVARSTIDAVDVGRVAAHFGGGGHKRAAAALIEHKDSKRVLEELKKILPEIIEAPVTVADIMSRGPQLLEPDLSIQSASERMHRFGHEGYPVVDKGHVVGLLTRREVDRAMSHGMGERPITTIMQAGSHTVRADDPIQVLQAVMVEHGWGQVPVVDNRDEIIGIVTRTDLINVLGVSVEEQGGGGLEDELESALSSARLALLKAISDEAERRQDALYIVGGFVRDLLLGTPSTDFDLVVEGDAIGLAQALVGQFGGRMTSHQRFGTAKWRLDLDNSTLTQTIEQAGGTPSDLPPTLDFVTARTEFYTQPTALPSVRQGNIKLDLHRRDFTINTLALRLDGRFYGQLLDYWGGGRDLRDGKIRVLHSISFVDDPTRMLRAVRLEQRLNFEIEPRTLELLKQALVLLDRVSGERIRNELHSSFMEEDWLSIGARLDELGLLDVIDPVLTWDEWLMERFRRARHFEPPGRWGATQGLDMEAVFYALWLFRCKEAEARRVCQRLRFQLAMEEQVLESNRIGRALADVSIDAPPSRVTFLLEQYGQMSLIAAWLALEEDTERRTMIDRYLTHWRHIAPTIDGTTLRESGLAPGPAYREILETLRSALLDGQISTEEEEKELCQKLIADHGHEA